MKKIISLMLLLTLFAGFAGCAQEQKYDAPELLAPIGKSISETIVSRENIYNTIVRNGEVIPEITEYSFLKNGRVSGVFVKVGDTVKAGDLIAVLDNVNDLAMVSSYEDAYNDYTEYYSHEIKEAKDIISQKDTTWQQKEILQLYIEQCERNLEREVALITEKLDEAEAEVELCNLYSDVSGQVIGVACQSGRSAYSDTPVIAIADDEKQYIICDYIAPDTMNTIHEIYTLLDGEKIPLRFVKNDKENLPSWSYFVPEDESIEFTIGDYAPVIAVTNFKPDVLTVLKDCVYKDEMGQYVYVTTDQNRTKTYVTLGQQGLNSYEVVSGLSENDKVFLKDDASTVTKSNSTILGDFIVTNRVKADTVYKKQQTLSATQSYGQLVFNQFYTDTFIKVKRGDKIAAYSEWISEDAIAETYFSLELAKLQKDYVQMSELEILLNDLAEAATEREITAPFDGMLISKELLYNGAPMPGTKVGVFASVDDLTMTVDNNSNSFRFGQRVTIEADIDGKIVYGTGTVITASKTGVKGAYGFSKATIKPDPEFEYLCLGTKRFVSVDSVVINDVVLVPQEAVSNISGEFAVVAGVDGMTKQLRFTNGKKNEMYYWAVDGIEADTEVLYK